jgi:hypothetical protein
MSTGGALDIPRGGGWHVTIFHPWLWLLLGTAIVVAAAWIVKARFTS